MNEYKKEDIKTGVISIHSVGNFFLDKISNEGVDLDFEDYIKENGDSQEIIDEYESQNPTVILGFIKDNNGKWDINPDAELSVIFNGNEQTVQVVKSPFVKTDCAWCSPCYSMQGQLDSNHGNVVCYTLDPEDLRENVGNETKSGTVELNNVR